MAENKEPDKSSGTGVSSPGLTKDLKTTNRAIKDEAQAWSVFDALVQAQDTRNQINSEIAKNYTGKQPKNPEDLKQQSRSWESNFPTLFLAGMVDRAVPSLTNSIDSARYLTQATLPEKIDDSEIENREKKIEAFREKFTKTVRRWREWRNFCSQICQEDVLIGYGFACWTDEDEWRPKFYRQDQAFVPESSPQFAQYFQVFGIREDILLHLMVDAIKNKEAADTSGWDIDNVIESVNNALPKDQQQANSDHSNPRTYADIIREGNQGSSFMTGAKVIQLGHLFAIEPDKKEGKGRITHFILDRNTHKLLFERERRYDEMSDVVAPFTLEPGNGTVYGSKGLGRMLVNLAISVDSITNDAVNQMKMAGMKVIKTDSKTGINAQIKVRSPFAVVTTDGELQKEDFPIEIEAFIALYTHLTKVAEIAGGAYIPNQLPEGETAGHATAREVTIDYTRELQSKSAFVARFAGQFAEMINTIQKRICKKDTVDDEAKAFQKELKDEGLSEKEIDLLANSPAMEVVKDLTGAENQQKVQVAAKYMGNPMIDQKKLIEADITAMTDPEFAKEIMLPDSIDPTMEVEQVRQQLMENEAIMTGGSIPVSPRDNDEIHLKVLGSELKSAAQSIGQRDPSTIEPELLDHINTGLVHYGAHIQNWGQKGAKPDVLKPYEQFLKLGDSLLAKLAQTIQAHAAHAHEVLSQHAALQQQAQQPPEDQIPQDDQQPPEQPIWTEKVLTAWIGQYDKLGDAERQRLEELGGLRNPQEASAQPPEAPISTDVQPNISEQPPVIQDQSTPVVAPPPPVEPPAIPPPETLPTDPTVPVS